MPHRSAFCRLVSMSPTVQLLEGVAAAAVAAGIAVACATAADAGSELLILPPFRNQMSFTLPVSICMQVPAFRNALTTARMTALDRVPPVGP